MRHARQEHDAFVDLMRERDVEVLLFHELLAETLEDADAREWLLSRRLRPEEVTVMFSEPLTEWMTEMPADELAGRLTGGITAADLPADEIAILGDSGSKRIDTLVHDLVEQSSRAGDIVQSESVGRAMLRLRSFMFERVYLGTRAQAERPRIERMMRALFDYHLEQLGDEQAVVDWLAGMTDRYAIREFENLSVPQGF